MKRNSCSGQVAILFTLSLVVTMGMIGLVVDFGWSYFRKIAAKTASEAAAVAAIKAVGTPNGFTCNTNGLTCQNDTACPATPSTPPDDNIGNGCLYAMQNGYVNSGNQIVTIAAHGSDGVASPVTGVSPTYWVSATVTENIPMLFSAVLGKRWGKVTTRSTAGLFQQPSGACIYSLDPGNSIGVNAGGNPNVQASCGIYANSTSSASLDVGGSSAVINASTIKLVGNYTTHGHPSITPAPSVFQSPTADPFASVPAVSAPAGHGCDSNAGIPNNPIMPADGYYTVCAGGFQMSGNPTVTLPAGIYIISAGNIALHNGTLTGTGVTFYLTGGFSGITINGNVDINLSAPTAGPTKGLLFYQDRSLAVGAFSSTINGDSGTIFNGSLYFPTTNITYSGGSSSVNTYTALVAWRISFQGNSYFAADPNGAKTGLGLPKMGLIE